MLPNLFDQKKSVAKQEPVLRAVEPVQASLLDIFDAEVKALETSRAVLKKSSVQGREEAEQSSTLQQPATNVYSTQARGQGRSQGREQGRTANVQEQLDLLSEKLEAVKLHAARLKGHSEAGGQPLSLSTDVGDELARPQRRKRPGMSALPHRSVASQSWGWIVFGAVAGFLIGVAYAIGFVPHLEMTHEGLLQQAKNDTLFGHSVIARALFGAVFGGLWGIIPFLVARQREGTQMLGARKMLRPENTGTVYSSWA